MYLLCSVIETVALKTTCFAVTQTLKLGWNCSSYLLSQLFSKPKRERNHKLIYLEDIVIHDIKMMDTRSKYIDNEYNEDSDDEYSEYHCDVVENKNNLKLAVPSQIEMKYPYIPSHGATYESTSAFTMHDSMRSGTEEKMNTEDNNALNKQVQIIKEIINDEKYLNDEMKKKEELEDYLKNQYDKKVIEEIDNEWVNIQVFE
jgi:hypothetical protein